MSMWRVRPGMIGVALVVSGFYVHTAFALWLAPLASRTGQQFACWEGLLFVVGFGLIAFQMAYAGPENKWWRVVAWLFVAASGMLAVLSVYLLSLRR